MAKSMNLNQAAGLQGMLKDGHKSFQGLHGAVMRNIEAGQAIAEMVHTSLGPNGMNKLVVNHLEKIIVTSDCATIMKELEVQHPAAKMLVLAAEMQQTEYGDNTNFCLSFAGELLRLTGDLLKNGLHTAEIVSGYQRAYDKVLEILPSLIVKNVDDIRDDEKVVEGIKNVLGTKQYDYASILSKLVVDASKITYSAGKKKPILNCESVRIAKLRGGNIEQSTVVKGLVCLRDTEGVVKRVEDAKIAVFGCGIEAATFEAKGTILLKNAEELLNYNKSEEKRMEELIAAISACGVNFVICNGAISEMAQHFLDKFNIMSLKILSKFELRRICAATGATAAIRLGPLTPEEIGECSLVEVKDIASRKVTVFNQKLDEDTSVATIVVRAATESFMNEIERALDDGIHSVEGLCKDGRLLAGAGAIELELSKQLREYADEVKGLDQYAIRKFAEAFDVIPRTLVENSGGDPTSVMHALHDAHKAPNSQNMGFDFIDVKAADAVTMGVYDVYITKLNALRLAVDAALTVLRVDQIVMSKPAGGPKKPQ